MIILNQHSQTLPQDMSLAYVKHRRLVSRMILPVTRWLRAKNTERYIPKHPQERLLDIGCGDGYFLGRMAGLFRERIGLDKLYGDELVDKIDFPNDHFDCVTMLAVIEHLDEPEKIMQEIARILKPGGKFIMTTPKHAAEFLVNLYVRDIEHEHKQYFNLSLVKKLATSDLILAGHHTFVFGLNQAFCLEKRR